MVVIFHNTTLYNATVDVPNGDTLVITYPTSNTDNPTLDEIKEGFFDSTEYDYIRVCEDGDDGVECVLNEYFAYLKYTVEQADDSITLTFTKPDLETRMNHVVKLAYNMRMASNDSVTAANIMLNDSANFLNNLIDDTLKIRR